MNIILINTNRTYTTDIKVGDKYINTHHPEKGVRIATEDTIKSILFTKSVAFGECYLKKV